MNEYFKQFDIRIKNIEPHVVAILAEIDGIKGEFKSGLRMSPQAITSLKRSVIITSAGASTRIEGSKLSDKAVQNILSKLSISKFSDRDSQEVQGYLEVLQNVFNAYQTLPIRESIIQSLHREALKYSTKDELHRGKYKTKENAVGVQNEDGTVKEIIFETTEAWVVEKEMSELIQWTHDAFENKRFHALLITANFLVEFLKIHPFEDGNGRLSRVLTNLLLIRNGYLFTQYVSHEQIVERRKDEYYLALQQSQTSFKTDRPTIDPWLNFFLGVVKEQATKALMYLHDEQAEDILSPKQLDVWKYLSSVNNASPAEISRSTNVGLPTVRQALARLVTMGKVKILGRGSSTRYTKI